MFPPAVEQYRKAAILLARAAQIQGFRSVLVCSATAGEGTTTTALGIAQALSMVSGMRVAVLELNCWRPVLGSMFNLDPARTLQAVETGRCAKECIQGDSDGISLLPASWTPTRLPELEPGRLIRQVLSDLEESVDMVLVDSPPVLERSVTLIAATIIPRVILVAEAGHARAEVLNRVERLFAAEGIELIGSVLNKHRRVIPRWLHRRLAG